MINSLLKGNTVKAKKCGDETGNSSEREHMKGRGTRFGILAVSMFLGCFVLGNMAGYFLGLSKWKATQAEIEALKIEVEGLSAAAAMLLDIAKPENARQWPSIIAEWKSKLESEIDSLGLHGQVPPEVIAEGAVRQGSQVASTKGTGKPSEFEEFIQSCAPLAAEFRSMRNAWSLGINYKDYCEANLRILNASDAAKLVPNNSLMESMMADAAEAMKFHKKAAQWWDNIIRIPKESRIGNRAETYRDEYRDEALKYGEAFLTAYEANK